MRVSSKSVQMQWLATLAQQQASIARIQEQVGSGKRIATAADDPAGAAQLILFRQGIERNQSYAVNADTAQRRLSLEEASLDQVTDILNRARELAVQAGGLASVAPASRQAIADEVVELRRSLVDAANAQDGEGRYLFAGNRVQTRPFQMVNESVQYGGDQGVRSQQIADDRLIQEGDSGAYVFAAVRNGNGVFSTAADAANQGTMQFTFASLVSPEFWVPDNYSIQFTAADQYDLLDGSGAIISAANAYTPGSIIAFAGASIGFEGEPAAGDRFSVTPSRNQDLFTTLQALADTLEAPVNSAADRARFQSQLNNSLLDLQQGLDHISTVRSQVGARLQVIDAQRAVNEEVSFQLEQSLSSVQDLDYASAISELQLRLLSLETAQKSYARTQTSSLFDFI